MLPSLPGTGEHAETMATDEARGIRTRLNGMSVYSAIGSGLDEFERAMKEGACGIRGDIDGMPVAAIGDVGLRRDGHPDAVAGFLSDVVVAALDDAGQGRDVLRDPGTILVLSTTKGDISGLLGSRGPVSLGPFAGRIRRHFNHSGYFELVSCACSSGGVAVARAARLLEAGLGDRALVIGFEMLDRFLVAGFGSLGALSANPARPFDESRDGLTLGEGAAAVMLVRDSLPGICLAGAGQSCDASGMVRPNEDGSGLRIAMERALSAAGSGEVDAICGHGTATVANDAMESVAMRSLFHDVQPPLFGLKGATGHTLGCCGVTEVVACAMALRGGYLPGTVGCDREIDGLDVVKSTRPNENRRLLSVNAGFGGINVALVLDRED